MSRFTQPEKFAEWVKEIDEEFVPAYEMDVDSDAAAESDDSDVE